MNANSVIKNCLQMLLLLVFSLNVYAEESPFKVFETDSLKIKLSKDGTGIVQGIQCYKCDYNFVKITANSKATNNGIEVNIMEAGKRAGKPAMISFTPSTREVQFIRW